jgi:hypothetical protein
VAPSASLHRLTSETEWRRPLLPGSCSSDTAHMWKRPFAWPVHTRCSSLDTTIAHTSVAAVRPSPSAVGVLTLATSLIRSPAMGAAHTCTEPSAWPEMTALTLQSRTQPGLHEREGRAREGHRRLPRARSQRPDGRGELKHRLHALHTRTIAIESHRIRFK